MKRIDWAAFRRPMLLYFATVAFVTAMVAFLKGWPPEQLCIAAVLCIVFGFLFVRDIKIHYDWKIDWAAFRRPMLLYFATVAFVTAMVAFLKGWPPEQLCIAAVLCIVFGFLFVRDIKIHHD